MVAESIAIRRYLQRGLGLALVLLLVVGYEMYIAQCVDAQRVDPFTTWTILDASPHGVKVVGEDIGRYQNQPFKGWYTDTVAIDPSTKTIVIAWVRPDADSYKNDFLYLAFLKPVDADGDGKPEAYQKVVKRVWTSSVIYSVDSLTVANGKVLVTLTFKNKYGRKAVAAILYDVRGKELWKGVVASFGDSDNMYSRSCYVRSSGKFLIVWYTTYKYLVEAKWLYYSGGWRTSEIFTVDSTDLYPSKADQMLCIGGNEKALVVFRKWDSKEGKPDLYVALVSSDSTVREVKLYDRDGVEETVGVRGAYTKGYFIVPLLSGRSVRYDIVRESDGYVWHRDYVTSNGAYPYAIALSDRFVLAWIDYYKDSDGEPKVANIDLTNFYIHPAHGVKVKSDSRYDKHPLIAYAGNYELLYVWSSSSNEANYDLEYAIIYLGKQPSDEPKVEYHEVLLQWNGDQRAHGLGALSLDQYVVAFTDTSDGEKDLLAYVALPDVMEGWTIEKYRLPDQGDEALKAIVDIIENSREIYIVVAYWHYDDVGKLLAETAVCAHDRGARVSVVMDNDVRNEEIEKYLREKGITVVDDSAARDEHHIMHDKFVVADDTLILLTANFNEEGFRENDNVVLIIRRAPSLAYFYREEARQMLHEVFGTSKELDFSFVVLTKEGVVFEGYFSPHLHGMKDWIPMAIYGYITRAGSGSYIAFTSYIFTTSGYVYPIYEALVDKHRAGAKVLGVFDEGMNLDAPGRMIYWFVDSGVPVRIDNHFGKTHAKVFAILDDNEKYYVSIVGSWNPTKSATINHDENVLVIREREPDLTKWLVSFVERIKSIPATKRYVPPHLVISRVAFQGSSENEWVEIYNPTSKTIDLSKYVIGDAEDLLHGDNEGLYKFPSGAKIGAHERIIVAYNSVAFHETYGFYPDYEIVNANSSIPDLVPYDPTKFTGSWNLEDSGDEVVLAVDEGNGFLRVVDAVWYGDSKYMETAMGEPESGKPLDITGAKPGYGIEDRGYVDGMWDAMEMSDKYVLKNLTNTPTRVSLSLPTKSILRISLVDPDKGGAELEKVVIDGKSQESTEINLDDLGLSEGIHSIDVLVKDCTPIGDGSWRFSYAKSLGVAVAPNNEKLYVLAPSSTLSTVFYDTYTDDRHRLVVLGTLRGTINVTIPEFWNVNAIEVYIDEAIAIGSWKIYGKVISVALGSSASNVTIVGGVPTNKPAKVVLELRGLNKVVLKAFDPDNMELRARVLVNSTEVWSGSGVGSLSYAYTLDTSTKKLYSITAIVNEETPSYTIATHKRVLYVAIIPSKTTIASSSTTIKSYRYVVINGTHHKIEILLGGSKSVLNVTKPSNWVKIYGVYLNGQPLPNNKWGISNSIIWIDPPTGSTNVTILGGPKAIATTTRGEGGGSTVLGGKAEPYSPWIAILPLITSATIATILWLTSQKTIRK